VREREREKERRWVRLGAAYSSERMYGRIGWCGLRGGGEGEGGTYANYSAHSPHNIINNGSNTAIYSLPNPSLSPSIPPARSLLPSLSLNHVRALALASSSTLSLAPTYAHVHDPPAPSLRSNEFIN
jgi:hypothetical protein